MKKYTMNDFITGKLSVRVNENNMMEFLKMCEAKGLRWASGCKATERNYPAETIEYYNDGVFCGLFFTRHDQLDRLAGRTIVDFSQIVNPSRYQIVIESDGDTTTAKMLVNGKEVKQVTAKRNPADKANWRIGAQTAFDRLWQKQPKPEKPAEKDNFKVGDRVVCVGESGNPAVAGKHGTVVDANDLNCLGVEFDEYINGNALSLSKLCLDIKDGHGWWCSPGMLRHEQPTKQKVREVKRHAKVGEWVKIVNKRGWCSERYKHGEILQVTGLSACGNAVLSCGGGPAFDDEYVVLEGYQPGRDA